MKLPGKLYKIEPYDPSEGTYKIKIDANENPCPPDGEITRAIGEALKKVPLNRYPAAGFQAVRSAAAKYFGVKPENITAGDGSDELISLLTNNFVPKGGKIMVSQPDFSMYSFYGSLAGNTIADQTRREGLYLDTDELARRAKTENADMVIFSNPCNPTGQGARKDKVLKLAKELDCLLIVDEAYMDFWGHSVLPEAAELDNVIVLRTCSKAFGLAGIRLGFAVANPEIISLIDRVRSPYNINALTQAAAETALMYPEKLKAATEYIKERTAELFAYVENIVKETDIENVPTVTNFVYLRTSRAAEIYKKLLARGICARLFNNALRITAGTQDENKTVAAALKEILEG